MTEKNKFQLKREATYTKLIEAGFEVLCQKGYSGASVDDIVQQAGFTKGAFYVHFKTKEQFMLDLLTYRKERRAEIHLPFISLIETGSSLEQIIRESMEIIVGQLQKTPEWILVYVDFYMQAKRHSNSRAVYQTLYDDWISEIRNFIDLLRANQFLPQETNSLEIAKMFYAYLDGCLLHDNLYKEMLNVPMVTKGFLAILNSK
ncbi:TetR/AcrR family transcriptional regulator [Halalkalibacter oceani]|uniref:TetR/AcrR family transcriptional regulator n=1 Tax=Halalkalibacter oceani TaxID=1653776 RepID=A0A9X2DNE6_9BACI|nr:TetR/AcrR family transcriptional regulator [Halalkalibacter oceani]MCM3714114.1 TetR/AcrR family transcriptional regulator [Halalkalibacter oceani]